MPTVLWNEDIHDEEESLMFKSQEPAAASAEAGSSY